MLLEEKVKVVCSYGFAEASAEAWHQKYLAHFHGARGRDLDGLTFSQYMDRVTSAGIKEPSQIGRGSDEFQLGRVGDVGDYGVKSCRFITGLQNRTEAHDNGCHTAGYRATGEKLSQQRTGTTKETCSRVAKMAETKTGRTKENHAGVASQADKLAKNFVLIAPDGTEHRGKNLFEFCQQHDLDARAFYKVFSGRQAHHKGWTGYYQV